MQPLHTRAVTDVLGTSCKPKRRSYHTGLLRKGNTSHRHETNVASGYLSSLPGVRKRQQKQTLNSCHFRESLSPTPDQSPPPPHTETPQPATAPEVFPSTKQGRAHFPEGEGERGLSSSTMNQPFPIRGPETGVRGTVKSRRKEQRPRFSEVLWAKTARKLWKAPDSYYFRTRSLNGEREGLGKVVYTETSEG